jgi:hypothetical protein
MGPLKTKTKPELSVIMDSDTIFKGDEISLLSPKKHNKS